MLGETMSKICDSVQALIQPIVESMNVELVEIEFKKHGDEDTLTVYIDKPGGVSLDDCEAVHNAIDAPLDELDPTNGKPYTLNVSSPGLDRPYKTLRDFRRHLGEETEFSLYRPVEGLKKFEAVLEDVDDDFTVVTVTREGKTIQLNIKDIALARAVIKF